MTEIIVDFVYMYMLVRDRRNPKVLLPNGRNCRFPHETTLFYLDPKATDATWTSEQLVRADVGLFSKTGDEYFRLNSSTPVSWPDRGDVLHMNDMDKAPADPNGPDPRRIRPELLASHHCHEDLNARVHLPTGYFRGLGAIKASGAWTRWTVIGANGVQRIWPCDHMQYTCQVDDNDGGFAVGVSAIGANGRSSHRWIPLRPQPSSGALRLIVVNRDPSTNHSGPSPNGLEDFAVLYGLTGAGPQAWSVPTGAATDETQSILLALQLPQGTTAKKSSKSESHPLDDIRPICGGGQGCPDPPDPDIPCE